MFAWLFCRHEWQVVDRGDLVRSGDSLTAGTQVGEWVASRCTKCGRHHTTRNVY